MGNLSNFTSNALLNHTFGGQTYTPPASIHVALFTTAPNLLTGSGGVEATGGGYTRAAVTNNTTNWPTTTNRTKTNGTAINYPTPTANLGLIVAFGFYDAASGGNWLGGATLATPRNVLSGEPLSFEANALTIGFDL